MKLINCRQIAQEIEDKIAAQVFSYCADPEAKTPLTRRPCLAIIKVGERPDSALYVRNKERQAKSVGIDANLYLLAENSTNEEMIAAIKFLNSDEMTDGILVQLPLPAQLDTDLIINTIDPEKDVDGFHPQNLAKLAGPDRNLALVSPVYASIISCLENIKFELSGKKVLVIGRSDIFTRQLDVFLSAYGALVEVFKFDEAWQNSAKVADLIISAVGEPGLITKDNLHAGVVIIDIGISQVDGKTVGDVDAESVADLDGYLTPVPGGIGPMTIALALKNTLESYIKHKINSHE